MSIIKVGRYTFELTNPDKVLFPQDGITKTDLVKYYQRVAPIMLPYVKGHPIAMVRYPNGIQGEGFFHKDTPDYFPSWITRVAVPRREDHKILHYVVINNIETITYLPSQGCITPHIWPSTMRLLHKPDRMIFDLDPAGKATFALVRKVAFLVKELLEELQLPPFVMTTGSRGVHVVVPLKQQHMFEEVRSFARDIAQYLADQYPSMITTTMQIKRRGNKIFLDYLRNSFTATAVAPYGVRPKPKAPVATPIEWDELSDSKLVSTRYTIKTVLKKFERDGDPWRSFKKSAHTLKKAQKKLDTLSETH